MCEEQIPPTLFFIDVSVSILSHQSVWLGFLSTTNIDVSVLILTVLDLWTTKSDILNKWNDSVTRMHTTDGGEKNSSELRTTMTALHIVL